MLSPMTVWRIKMGVSAAIDFADLTIGMTPGVGHLKEVAVIPIAMGLWGWRGGIYALELVDYTNLMDGLVPTASFIGFSKREEYQQRHREWKARQEAPAQPARSADAITVSQEPASLHPSA